MHIEIAYRLKMNIPGVEAGTIFIEHPKAVNRFYPESAYENGELIQSMHIYGFLLHDVKNTSWFECVARQIIPEVKDSAKEWELLQDLPVEKAGTRIILKDNDYVVKETGASFPYSPLVNGNWFRVVEEEPKSWRENAINSVFENKCEYTESDINRAFSEGINSVKSPICSNQLLNLFLIKLKSEKRKS